MSKSDYLLRIEEGSEYLIQAHQNEMISMRAKDFIANDDRETPYLLPVTENFEVTVPAEICSIENEEIAPASMNGSAWFRYTAPRTGHYTLTVGITSSFSSFGHSGSGIGVVNNLEPSVELNLGLFPGEFKVYLEQGDFIDLVAYQSGYIDDSPTLRIGCEGYFGNGDNVENAIPLGTMYGSVSFVDIASATLTQEELSNPNEDSTWGSLWWEFKNMEYGDYEILVEHDGPGNLESSLTAIGLGKYSGETYALAGAVSTGFHDDKLSLSLSNKDDIIYIRYAAKKVYDSPVKVSVNPATSAGSTSSRYLVRHSTIIPISEIEYTGVEGNLSSLRLAMTILAEGTTHDESFVNLFYYFLKHPYAINNLELSPIFTVQEPTNLNPIEDSKDFLNRVKLHRAKLMEIRRWALSALSADASDIQNIASSELGFYMDIDVIDAYALASTVSSILSMAETAESITTAVPFEELWPESWTPLSVLEWIQNSSSDWTFQSGEKDRRGYIQANFLILNSYKEKVLDVLASVSNHGRELNFYHGTASNFAKLVSCNEFLSGINNESTVLPLLSDYFHYNSYLPTRSMNNAGQYWAYSLPDPTFGNSWGMTNNEWHQILRDQDLLANVGTFEDWAANHYNHDPSFSKQRLLDDDNDGVNNFEEYAFGSDPCSSSDIPVPIVLNNSQQSLVVKKRIAPIDIKYKLLRTDLQGFEKELPLVDAFSSYADDQLEIMNLNIPDQFTEDKAFFMLEVDSE